MMSTGARRTRSTALDYFRHITGSSSSAALHSQHLLLYRLPHLRLAISLRPVHDHGVLLLLLMRLRQPRRPRRQLKRCLPTGCDSTAAAAVVTGVGAAALIWATLRGAEAVREEWRGINGRDRRSRLPLLQRVARTRGSNNNYNTNTTTNNRSHAGAAACPSQHLQPGPHRSNSSGRQCSTRCPDPHSYSPLILPSRRY